MFRRTFLNLCSGFAFVAALMLKDARAFTVTCEKQCVRRWTLATSIRQGERCRHVGWVDEHGNVHVALKDAYDNPHFTEREKWMVNPPVGQMHFRELPIGEFQFTPASNKYPGMDYGMGRYPEDEGRLVVPAFLSSDKAPADFETLWNNAKHISNCPEGCQLFQHYLHHG